MVLLPDLFEGREACEIWLRLPVSEVALLFTEIYFGNRLLNVDCSFHIGLNCTSDDGVIQVVNAQEDLQNHKRLYYGAFSGRNWIRTGEICHA